jgi:2-polyprenyl-3-methyl-5-hydroxy-6-metoxy-1,4-benzoquinol methylase
MVKSIIEISMNTRQDARRNDCNEICDGFTYLTFQKGLIKMSEMKCWVCGKNAFSRVGGTDELSLQPDRFKITDANYSISLPRYKCHNCGFIQCDTADVTKFYEELEDEEYISSGNQRTLQFKKLLKNVKHYIPANGKILDIGAGSGLFLREAENLGYSAIGIEPSLFLANAGKEDGLNIIQGTFPENCPCEKYDAIFLTDVIEHIADPLPMLKSIPNFLATGGKVIVTTPDVSSIMARVMGRKWWHYRIAHIGYYNRHTLEMIMDSAGMRLVKVKYAKWYFSSRYIAERLLKYLPFAKPLSKLAPKKLMIPLNLFDSQLFVFKMKDNI